MHMINIVFIIKSEFSMSFKKVLYIQLCLHRSYVCVCMLLMTANYLWEGYRPEERGTLRGGFLRELYQYLCKEIQYLKKIMENFELFGRQAQLDSKLHPLVYQL